MPYISKEWEIPVGLTASQKSSVINREIIYQLQFMSNSVNCFFSNSQELCKLFFLGMVVVCWFSCSFVSEVRACFWGMVVRGFARRDLC